MSKRAGAKNSFATTIKRHTSIDVHRARALLKEAYVKGEGFHSQYASDASFSCATTAICAYTLAALGWLSPTRRNELVVVLRAMRKPTASQPGIAFPDTARGEPNVWSTGQAVLALLALKADWEDIKPSVLWLLERQGSGGSWSYRGDDRSNERLIYAIYPTLVLRRCRKRLGRKGIDTMSRTREFIESCNERSDPFWDPCIAFLRAATSGDRSPRRLSPPDLTAYANLFDGDWPGRQFTESRDAGRFTLKLFGAANYLFLRGPIEPTNPVALLHIRRLADEYLEKGGWNDGDGNEPMVWATALGLLTLYRWWQDCQHAGGPPARLPARDVLVRTARIAAGPSAQVAAPARTLIDRLKRIEVGKAHAMKYQQWVADALSFLFPTSLGNVKLEVPTSLGTHRFDVTFRVVAGSGPWYEWKMRHDLVASIVIECKNKEKLTANDVGQAAGYLGKHRGRLGILATRHATLKDHQNRLNSYINDGEKFLLIVNDRDVVEWLQLRDEEARTNALHEIYRSLREKSQ